MSSEKLDLNRESMSLLEDKKLTIFTGWQSYAKDKPSKKNLQKLKSKQF